MVEILISTSFRWLFRRSIVVDGNFHADHLKMQHPEDDVTLADGLAFMVETKPYLKHISESRDIKQACFLLLFSFLFMAQSNLIRNLLATIIGP
jgi:hypothetical protein